jgi:hypothetical protein
MATYVNNLRLKEITTGDEDGTWGTSTNTNLELITDGFSYGTKEIAADANETFTMPDATADATRSLYLKFTSAVSLTATREITLGPNTVSKTWIIENATTGGQIITIKQGSGATVNVANGSKVMVVTDGAGAGAAVLNANPTEAGTGTVTSVGGTGTVNGISLSGTVTSSGNLTLGGALTGVDLTTQVTGTLPVANGGTGASLVDPNADRIFFWDDSAGSTAFLTVGSGLEISGTTLSSTDAGGTVTSVGGTGTVNGITLSGTVTASGDLTLGGTLSGVDLTSQITGTLPVANGGTGATTLTANNVLLGNGTSAPQAVAPSTSGNVLTSNGSTWVSSAAPSSDPTLGTLTKTFTLGEASTINLTSSVLSPVVSVTKEVPQSGVTNNNWDVNSTTENYTRLNSAYATTLDWVGNLATGSLSNSFSVSAQEATPFDIAFNTDGTKMFIVGDTSDNVTEYSLSTAFDLSTKSYSQAFSVASQETNPYGLFFSPDGTKMFVVGQASDNVNEYTLSTGFDVSTASITNTFNVSSQESIPTGVTFNNSGTKMYIVGNTSSVYQYTLSTAFNVSTASYDSVSFSVSSEAPNARGIIFNSDGTEMLISSVNTDKIFKYSLSTGFDISTASYTSISLSVSQTDPWGMAFNADRTKLFLPNYANSTVYEYTLPLALALGTGSFASADVGKTIEANDGVFVLTATSGSYVETTAPTSYDQVASGSWEMYGVVYNAVDGDLELSGGLFNTFDVSTAVYSQTFSVSAQETDPTGLAFSTDGTKMFVSGYTGSVYEYTLSAAFDVSTASFVDSFSIAAQEGTPQQLTFNPDGTKMFIVGTTGDDVNEYTLSTGFDISTASFVDSFSVSAQDTAPLGLAFNTDGTKMFVVGSQGKDVNEYTLSTGFDVSTASFVDSFSVSAQDSVPYGMAFNTDGTKMFIVGFSGDIVSQYTLSTGFDISTASFVQSFSVASQETSPTSIAFNNDGSKMFIIGSIGDDVNEYSIGSTAFPTGYQPVHTTQSTDTQYWTDINSMTADQAAGDGNIYYAISTDDRTTWTVIDNTDGERDIVRNNAGTWQYNSNGTYASETWVNGATNTELATLAEAMEGAVGGYGLANGTYLQGFSVTSQETRPTGIAFNTTGTKMFVLGNTGQDVNEYALSIGFDVSTASFTDAFSVAGQDTSPWGIAFNTDGTKMFILGVTGQDVNEYTLSAGFDVSTASFVDSFSVAAQTGAEPTDLAFNTDGTKMFVLGTTNNNVNEYTLSTGFDVSTASFVDAFNVASQDTSPFGLAFNTDGTKMFVLGNIGDDINEYTLSTGFDVSTASYTQVFSIAAQEIYPEGLAFSADGTKMYICGQEGDSVYEYSTASYINQMDKTQLDAVTDPNHIALGNDLDLSIIFNMTSGTTVPSSDGVAINYDANVLNKGAVLGTDYDFDAPAGDEARITALTAGNFKVRVV